MSRTARSCGHSPEKIANVLNRYVRNVETLSRQGRGTAVHTVKENDMIGTPSDLTVRVSRKLTDGEYGSFEVSAELTTNLPQGANLEEAFDGLDSWLTASVAKSVQEKRARIEKQQAESHVAPGLDVAVAAPIAAPVIEVRTPVSEENTEYVMIDVKYLECVVSKNGKKYVKVHGGQYSKFGVPAWPEPLEAVGLDVEAMQPGQNYMLPQGYSKAKIELEDGKPKRVWKFEK
jgi:hypothetical protein